MVQFGLAWKINIKYNAITNSNSKTDPVLFNQVVTEFSSRGWLGVEVVEVPRIELETSWLLIRYFFHSPNEVT
jgi:hypothetical protein